MFVQMKMRGLTAVFLIFICAITAFCACDGSFDYANIGGDGFFAPTLSPYQGQTIPNKESRTYNVYVCGAVQNEGYYIVTEGKTVADVISLAGLLPQTIFPENATTYIKFDCQIVVNYHENGTNYHSVNANGAFVQNNFVAPNIPKSVVEKLHSYYTQNGTITSKQILKQILTHDEYQQHHYKFYVEECDYVSAS